MIDPIPRVSAEDRALLLEVMRGNVRLRANFARSNIEALFSLARRQLVTNADPESGLGPVLYLTPSGAAAVFAQQPTRVVVGDGAMRFTPNPTLGSRNED